MRHPHPAASLLATSLLAATAGAFQTAQGPSTRLGTGPAAPVAVRNERPRTGREMLVLRHQELKKGEHDAYYRASRAGVWPWYEQIGTRVVGQWLVVDRDGRAVDATPSDDAYRLARYASVEHWQAMRPDRAVLLGGNGPDEQAWRAALDAQAHVTRETSVELMQGEMYSSPPIFNPSLPERYRLTR